MDEKKVLDMSEKICSFCALNMHRRQKTMQTTALYQTTEAIFTGWWWWPLNQGSTGGEICV